jgi:hypothetical protein
LPAGVLVKNVSIVLVTGSLISFRSDGNLLPICAVSDNAGKNETNKEDTNNKIFIFIQQYN